MAGTNEDGIWTRFVSAGYYKEATDYSEGRKCLKCRSPKVCNNYYCLLCKVGGLCPTAFQQNGPHCLHPWMQVRRHNMRNVVAAKDLERFINIDSVNLIYKCSQNGVDLCYLERPKLCWIDPEEPYDTINNDVDSPESRSLASITEVYPSLPRALPAELSESVWNVYASSSKRRPAESSATSSKKPVVEGRTRKCQNCRDCMLIPLSEFLLGGILVCSVQCLESLATHYSDMNLLRLKAGSLERTHWPLTTKEKLRINVAAARSSAHRNVVFRNRGEVPQAVPTPTTDISAPVALAASAETASLNASGEEPAPVRTKRGRPAKASTREPAPVRRNRGRQAKASRGEPEPAPAKRKRGRPRKVHPAGHPHVASNEDEVEREGS